METNQPPAEGIPSANPAPLPGILAGKLPASASFVIGLLLFLMPFVDIRCGSVSVKQATGIELATGFEIRDTRPNNSLFGNGNGTPMLDGDTRRGDKFALAALLLGLAAAIVALMNFKARSFLGMILGAATTLSLIALMIDIKSRIRSDSQPGYNNNNGFDLNLGNDINITANFTGYFYLAVILFALGAYFSYKQRTVKT